MALDGVPAAFELEVGVPDMARFIEARRGRSPIHFGASTSYLAARLLAWDTSLPPSTLGPDAGIIPQSGPATNEAASPERFAHILDTLGTQMELGALGVGIGLECSPGSTRRFPNEPLLQSLGLVGADDASVASPSEIAAPR